MTHWTITFVVLAIIAGFFGFSEFGDGPSFMGEAFCIVFLILSGITVIIGKTKLPH